MSASSSAVSNATIHAGSDDGKKSFYNQALVAIMPRHAPRKHRSSRKFWSRAEAQTYTVLSMLMHDNTRLLALRRLLLLHEDG